MDQGHLWGLKRFIAQYDDYLPSLIQGGSGPKDDGAGVGEDLLGSG